MRTKHLFVLILIRNKGEVGSIKQYKIFYSQFQGGASFVGPYCYLFHVCHAFLFVHCSLVVSCWELADLLALLYVIFSCIFVTFPCGVLGQV